MRSKNRIGYWIFTFGVLMLLLRPYLVYQVAAADSRQANPARAWSLLQRLVKKKDDHHEQFADHEAVFTDTRKRSVMPVRRTFHLLRQFLANLPGISLTVPLLSSKFHLPVQTHRYRLTSCLLI